MSQDENYRNERPISNARKYYDLVMFVVYFLLGIAIALNILNLELTVTVRWVISGLFIIYSFYRFYRFVHAHRK